ncbi:hypothetical protein P8452_14768 [Trifolium repens]|nr:hypothetical protein P8452_14768 [Trifolium repens]
MSHSSLFRFIFLSLKISNPIPFSFTLVTKLFPIKNEPTGPVSSPIEVQIVEPPSTLVQTNDVNNDEKNSKNKRKVGEASTLPATNEANIEAGDTGSNFEKHREEDKWGRRGSNSLEGGGWC